MMMQKYIFFMLLNKKSADLLLFVASQSLFFVHLEINRGNWTIILIHK